jgi:hypothetical protein
LEERKQVTEALEAAGVTIERNDGGWGAVAEIKNFRTGGSATSIDVTHLGSTFKEKLMGIPDEGQLTFDLNTIPANAVQTGLRTDRKARTRREFRLTLTDVGATVLSFHGYVLSFETSGDVDASVASSVTIEVDGEITWA